MRASGGISGRIIGVDPGNVVTGFGVVEGSAAHPAHIAAGTIRPPTALRGGERLKTIHDRLLGLIDEYAPAAMSLERSFVAANVQSAFRLGEARATAMLAAAARGLELFEYTPTEVKLTVAGHGHADKAQVKFMVRRALGVGDQGRARRRRFRCARDRALPSVLRACDGGRGRGCFGAAQAG